MPNYNIFSRISGETKCTEKKTVQMLPAGSQWLLRLRARTRSSAPFCPFSVPHPLSAAPGANTWHSGEEHPREKHMGFDSGTVTCALS